MMYLYVYNIPYLIFTKKKNKTENTIIHLISLIPYLFLLHI